MSGDILTADILATEATDGEVRAQLGDAALGKGFAQEVAIYGVDGFVGRPNPPDAEGNAAQALYLQDGDDAQIFGTRDNRWVDKVGTMDPGDRGIITDADARVFVKQVRSAVVLYTLNQPADASMLIDLGGAEGKIRIVNGGAVVEMENDVINLSVNGGGGIKISADGVTISGSAIQLVAEVVQLGQLGPGVPPPAIAGSPGAAVQATPPIALPPASTKVFIAP